MSRRLVLCLLLTLSTWAGAAERWHLAQDEDGIKVYLSEVPGSQYQQ
ncbi:lipid-binding protein, partial [Pseudomonas frederiksbergensis]|nr:lipid-binding protein [Pseudomonas frederiksbergensis]